MGRQKLTQEEFINLAKEIHNNKYDYSKVNYIDKRSKVIIICPFHGEFLQTPEKHLYGLGCPQCAKSKTKQCITKEEFILRSKEVHGDYYNYDKANIVNTSTKVIITCPKHGDFEQTPSMHMSGQGCPLCGKEKQIKSRSLTVEKFIKKSKLAHGNFYDYSLIKEIFGSKDKVPIICPIHGKFEQNAYTHYTGTGCPKCGRIKAAKNKTKTFKEFILELLNTNKNIKCLSTEYINYETKLKFQCGICGNIWETTPHSILSSKECPECAKQRVKQKLTKSEEQFLKELYNINPNILVLSKYINDRTYVLFKCLKCSNIYQNSPNHLLKGIGCPKCAYENRKLSLEEWIERANNIHNHKYDYSKVIYTKGKDKVCIICPEHGEFWQEAEGHLLGRGCPKCSRTYGEQIISNFLDYNHIDYKELVTIDVHTLARTSNFVDIDFVVNYKNKIYYIEYNGKQHYEYTPFFHKGGIVDFDNLVRRDNVLRNYCKDNNIELIEIKYDLSADQINTYLNSIFCD